MQDITVHHLMWARAPKHTLNYQKSLEYTYSHQALVASRHEKFFFQILKEIFHFETSSVDLQGVTTCAREWWLCNVVEAHTMTCANNNYFSESLYSIQNKLHLKWVTLT